MADEAESHETEAAAALWVVGLVVLAILKRTVFVTTWGSSDLAVHWHYWAAQVVWTVVVVWGAHMLGRRPAK